jgi:hypothetical protein
MLLDVVVIFMLCFIQRSLFRIVNKNHIGFDTYFHLFLIREKQKKRKSFVSSLDTNRFIESTEITYPNLFHWLISLLPKKGLQVYERFLNPVLESIFAVIIYILVFQLNRDKAIVASVLFIVTPIFFSLLSIGPRVISLTPRLFGEMLVNLFFIVILLYQKTESWELLLVASFLACSVFLSSKFSAQALVFISFTCSVISLSVIYFSAVLCGILLATVASKGKYLKTLSDHVRHLIWYYRNNKLGKMEISERNSFKTFFRSVVSLDFKELYRQVFFKNTYLIVLIKFPLSLFAFVQIWILNDPSLLFFNSKAIIISGFLVFILTSQNRFLFLGEAERYLIHIVFPIFLISTLSLSQPIFIIVIVYGISFQLLEFCIFRFIRRKINPVGSERVIKRLQEMDKTLKIATIPYHVGGGWRIVYETKHDWLYPVVWPEDERKGFDKYVYKYPIIDPRRIDVIAKEYEIDVFILDKNIFNNDFFDIRFSKTIKKEFIGDDFLLLYTQKEH